MPKSINKLSLLNTHLPFLSSVAFRFHKILICRFITINKRTTGLQWSVCYRKIEPHQLCDDILNTSLCQERIKWSNCNHMLLIHPEDTAVSDTFFIVGEDYSSKINIYSVLKLVNTQTHINTYVNNIKRVPVLQY